MSLSPLLLALGALSPSHAQTCDPSGGGCDIESDYGSDALPPAPLRVGWDTLTSPDDVVTLATGRTREPLWLQVRNDTDRTLLARVDVTLRTDAGWSTATPSTGATLRPGTPLSLDIDPSALGSNLTGLSHSAELRLTTTFTDMAGAVVARASAPTVYLHETTAGVVVYGVGALMSQFGGGDLGGSPAFPAAMSYQVPQQALAGYDAPPPHALASDEIELCFQYHYDFDDSGTGEDFYTATEDVDMWMRASGIQVSVTPPNGLPPFAGRVDEDGCVVVGFDEGDYQLLVTANARLSDQGKAVVFTGEDAGVVHTWAPGLVTDPQDAGQRVYVALASHHVTDVMAATTQTMWRVLADVQPPAAQTTFALDVGGNSHPYCKVACRAGATLYFNPECNFGAGAYCDPGVTREKYGVGHEVGHFVSGQFFGVQYTDSYDDLGNVDIEGCSFADQDGPGGHALRSLERSAQALNEGFAHYIATLGWHRHRGDYGQITQSEFDELWEAHFVYYKEEMFDPDDQYLDLAGVGWRVPLAGNHIGDGDLDWRNTVCEVNGDVAPGDETEIDWLRFFWDLRSHPLDGVQAPVPSTQTILEALDALGTLGAQTASAQTWCVEHPSFTGLRDRWQTLALAHGVDPVAPPACD